MKTSLKAALLAGVLSLQLAAAFAEPAYRVIVTKVGFPSAASQSTNGNNSSPLPDGTNCVLPWGTPLASGQSVPAYSVSSVMSPAACDSAAITESCANGVLSDPTASQSCSVTMRSCTLPWGDTLGNGETLGGTVYSAATVPFPTSCDSLIVSERCSDGTLSYPTASLTCNQTDPYWSSVSVLLHLDTSFTDVKGASVSTAGAPTISHSSFKVGSGSAVMGSNSSLLLTNGALNVGTGDFTVELWYQNTGTNNGYISLFGNNGNQGSNISVMFGDSGYGHRLFMIVGNNPGNLYASSVTKTTIGSGWHHYALTRAAGTVHLFYDGTEVASKSGITASFTSNSFQLGSGLVGNIDEVRVTKGVARYVSNFTPYTTPFPNQ